MFCVFWNKATAFRNCFLGLCCQGQYSRSIEHLMGFPVGSDGKESTCNMGDLGSIPGLGRPSGERHSNPLQYSCLENPMDRGAWKAVVHGVKKIRTQLSDLAQHRTEHLIGSGIKIFFPNPLLMSCALLNKSLHLSETWVFSGIKW